jgi:hypothetical protein
LAPWTQSVSVRWRPALRFYTKGVEILGDLDERKVLRAFKVGVDQIDARILSGHELSIRQGGLWLEIFGQDADVDEVWEFVVSAVETIKPAAMGGVGTQFQHLVPLDVPYDVALPLSRDSFLRPPPGGEEITDWALVVNLAGGAATEPANAGPSVEFGVVSGREAMGRLTREVGGAASIGGSGLNSRVRWQQVEFPAVALFADSAWPQDPTIETKGLPDVRAYFDATRERACKFVESMGEQIRVNQGIGGSLES